MSTVGKRTYYTFSTQQQNTLVISIYDHKVQGKAIEFFKGIQTAMRVGTRIQFQGADASESVYGSAQKMVDVIMDGYRKKHWLRTSAFGIMIANLWHKIWGGSAEWLELRTKAQDIVTMAGNYKPESPKESTLGRTSSPPPVLPVAPQFPTLVAEPPALPDTYGKCFLALGSEIDKGAACDINVSLRLIEKMKSWGNNCPLMFIFVRASNKTPPPVIDLRIVEQLAKSFRGTFKTQDGGLPVLDEAIKLQNVEYIKVILDVMILHAPKDFEWPIALRYAIVSGVDDSAQKLINSIPVPVLQKSNVLQRVFEEVIEREDNKVVSDDVLRAIIHKSAELILQPNMLECVYRMGKLGLCVEEIKKQHPDFNWKILSSPGLSTKVTMALLFTLSKEELQAVCDDGNLLLEHLLLNVITDINRGDDKESPIYSYASTLAERDLVYYIQNYLDPDLFGHVNASGETILHHLLKHSISPEVLAALSGKISEDVLVKFFSTPIQGRYPIEIATSSQTTGETMLQYLLRQPISPRVLPALLGGMAEDVLVKFLGTPDNHFYPIEIAVLCKLDTQIIKSIIEHMEKVLSTISPKESSDRLHQVLVDIFSHKCGNIPLGTTRAFIRHLSTEVLQSDFDAASSKTTTMLHRIFDNKVPVVVEDLKEFITKSGEDLLLRTRYNTYEYPIEVAIEKGYSDEVLLYLMQRMLDPITKQFGEKASDFLASFRVINSKYSSKLQELFTRARRQAGT